MRNASRTLTLTAVVALAALMGTAGAVGLHQGFNGSFPPFGWTVVDSAGTGVDWRRNTAWGDANWTGGIGACAEVSSSHSPGLDYDTLLQSPVFTVPPDAVLFFRANYQNFLGQDHFEVWVRIAGSAYALLSWSEDHGSFESPPGDGPVVDMSTWVGESVQLEFRYYDDPGSIHDDYYIQVDDVIVDDETSIRQAAWGAIKALYR